MKKEFSISEAMHFTAAAAAKHAKLKAKIFLELTSYFEADDITEYLSHACENWGKSNASSGGILSDTWQKIQNAIIADERLAAMFAMMKYLYFLYTCCEENFGGDEEFDEGYSVLRIMYSLAPAIEDRL